MILKVNEKEYLLFIFVYEEMQSIMCIIIFSYLKFLTWRKKNHLFPQSVSETTLHSPAGSVTTGCQDSMDSRRMLWQQCSQYQDMVVR